MRYTFALYVVIFTMFSANAFSQQDEPANVLSYYAVGNSLDGQIFIDTPNLLRFYPVFAERYNTDTVRVTAYYGPNTFTRLATRMEDGRYWQILLPPFHLGEAIQRLEVETHIRLDSSFAKQLREIATGRQAIDNAIKEYQDNLRRASSDISLYSKEIETANASLKTQTTDLASVTNDLRQGVTTRCPELKKSLDFLSNTLATSIKNIPTPPDPIAGSPYQIALEGIKADFDKQVATTSQFVEPIATTAAHIQVLLDKSQQLATDATDLLSRVKRRSSEDLSPSGIASQKELMILQDSIFNRITSRVVDTNYLGIGVRRSDITIDDSLTGAKILYRNYKPGLRQLPALDPAEKLGIFRARYIPFAVINGRIRGPFGNHADSLRPPVGIFEIGLGFDDVVLPGDDFVKPELSIRRIGVAFAVTEKLFNNDAQILALAFTYDFNAYGSIAVGANFAPIKDNKSPETYFSFGINKLAFEGLLGQLQKVFQ